jgi:cytochrome c oxidase assembly protein subunit 15
VVIAVMTTKFWESPDRIAVDQKKVAPIKTIAIATTVAIYAQLALGATMRHQHKDLAILDFPTAYGAWIPDTSEYKLALINGWRDAHGFSDVNAFQIWLQMTHRFVALSIGLGVILFRGRVWRDLQQIGALKRLSILWVVLFFVQFALGAWTIWSNKAADVATTHVAVGAMMLSFGVSTWAICGRILQPRNA